MESKAKFLGHPVHPMLIVFPLGLLATSVIFDVIYLVSGNDLWAEMTFWLIAAGIIGGVLAAIFGLVDWLAIPGGTRAKAVGAWHGTGNLVVTGLFAVSWILRADAPRDPELLAHLASFAGAGLSLATAWLGGELIDRLGVGVDDGAHLNSPNSLSNRPASEDATPAPRTNKGGDITPA